MDKNINSPGLLYSITNWVLFIAGLANLVIGTIAAFNANTSLAIATLTAGLILLFAATIERFESLKGLGIEAKTKQLNQKIVQAEEALRRIRELTELTGSAIIDFNSKMGRWDSTPTTRDTIALASRVRQIMKDLGSDDTVIAKALRPWAKVLCFDIAYSQSRPLNQLLLDRVKVLDAERNKIKTPIDPNDPLYIQLNARIGSIYEFKKRLNNFHLLDLEDYPDKFMEVFENVPEIDPHEIEALRRTASIFSPGMVSLRDNQTLSDQEFWIVELNKAREQG